MMNTVKQKGKKKMPRTKSDSFSRKVNVLDENFNFVEKQVEGKFNDPKTYEDAVLAFGGDQGKVLDALVSVLRQKQILAKISEVSGGIEERYVLKFIKPMRSMAPFDNPASVAPDGKEIGTNKKGDIDEGRQTEAILAQIKTIPFLLDGLKDFCKKQAIAEAEGEETTE